MLVTKSVTYLNIMWTCACVSLFGNNFLTVHNFGVFKEMNVYQEGPMYTHSDFHTSAQARAQW